MVALVRGVHGLQWRGPRRGPDRPAGGALRPAHVLFREGDDRPLTIAVGRGRRGRSRLAPALPRGRRRATAPTACATPISRRSSDPTRTWPAAPYYWHEVIGCAVRGSTAPSSARSRTSTASARPRSSSSAAVRSASSTCRRSGRSSGSSRRVAARSWSTPTSLDLQPRKARRPGSAQGATPPARGAPPVDRG